MMKTAAKPNRTEPNRVSLYIGETTISDSVGILTKKNRLEPVQTHFHPVPPSGWTIFKNRVLTDGNRFFTFDQKIRFTIRFTHDKTTAL